MLKRLLMGCLLFSGTAVFAQDVTPRTVAPNPDAVQLEVVADGFDRPLFVTHAGDGSNRLFIMEQSGKIYVRQNDTQSVFLDVSELLTWDVFAGGYTERGLLGLAFSPTYATDGRFYINYTDGSGGTVVARYHVSAEDANVADPTSAEIILTVDQPFPNHNGGHMAFGADGYLYISLGDGGAAGDPLGAGQNLGTLLGKILRIDVNVESGYLIPDTNPFVGIADARPEIWAYGVRNVWRFAFDRTTGDLYLADVGQNLWEEVNFQPTDSLGGENYGWNAFEADKVFNPNTQATSPVYPVASYEHGRACSVTGGYVYRGTAIADLVGTYLYGDFCSGTIYWLYQDSAKAWQNGTFQEANFPISSFGEDEQGELYVIDHNGRVLKLVPSN